MDAPRYKNDQTLYLHLDDLSRMVGITVQRLRQMSHEGHYPLAINGFVDLYVTIPAIVKYLRAGGQLERQRMAKAKADLAEMKALEMKGKLIEIDAIEQQWLEVTARFKQKMFSIPNRVAPNVAVETSPTVIVDILQNMIEEACRELSMAKAVEDYPEQFEEFTDGSVADEQSDGDGEEFEEAAEDEDLGISSEFDEADSLGDEGDDASAEDDGERLGRHSSEAEQRSQR